MLVGLCAVREVGVVVIAGIGRRWGRASGKGEEGLPKGGADGDERVGGGRYGSTYVLTDRSKRARMCW
jgi:hypothetical protein